MGSASSHAAPPAPRGEVRFREAEHALWQSVGLTPTERRVRLDRHGAEVRIQEVGHGAPVLFVHGSPNSGSAWAPLAPHLDGVHCIFLDRPGTGLSDPVTIPPGGEEAYVRSLIPDVLDALEIDRADLVVSSLGGYMGLLAAALQPHRIARMVQMGCPGPVLDAPAVAFLRMLGIPGVARLMGRMPPSRRGVQMQLRQIGHGASLDAGLIPPPVLDWLLALMRDTATGREELAFMRRVVTLRGFRPDIFLTAEDLAGVQVATTFLWGDADAFGDVDLARRIVEAMPDARLEVLAGAGHLAWLDDPRRAGELVSSFLNEGRSVEPGGASR